VARQDVRMHAARNDFAVDQHAVAIEDNEIEFHKSLSAGACLIESEPGSDLFLRVFFTRTGATSLENAMFQDLSSSSGTQYNSSR
jgi:hypothetical protein